MIVQNSVRTTFEEETINIPQLTLVFSPIHLIKRRFLPTIDLEFDVAIRSIWIVEDNSDTNPLPCSTLKVERSSPKRDSCSRVANCAWTTGFSARGEFGTYFFALFAWAIDVEFTLAMPPPHYPD